MKKKLTKKAVDNAWPEAQKDFVLWDTELRGFGLRVKPSGVKSFIVQYRNANGQSRRHTIGQYGRLTVDQARSDAKILLGDVERGGDPAARAKEARQAISIAAMCDAYFEDALAGRVLYRGRAKKAGTLDIDRGRIERHIKPLLGSKRAGSLSRQDIEKFMHAVIEGKTAGDWDSDKPRGKARVRGGTGTALKSVSLLSAIYNYAIRKEWVEVNPCVGIDKPTENVRDRHLTTIEYQKLGEALCRAEDDGVSPVAVAAIRVLALTGCRRNEILKLKLSEINANDRCLRLEDTKSGKQTRPIGRTALDVIDGLEFHSSTWAFPSTKGDGPLVNIRKPFIEILKMAKLDMDITPHVLRHSFATVAHELNYSELTIAGLLGHRSGSVTARYAHNVDSALAAAADKVSSEIATRLGMLGNNADNVVVLGTGGQ